MSPDAPHLAFISEAGKVLPQFVAKSATRILGVRKDGGQPDYRGTALLCIINGRPAFITANHVLTEAEKTGYYKHIGISAVTSGFNAQYYRFRHIDIAVIVPDTNITIGNGCVFWPEAACDRDQPETVLASDYMIAYGFPERFSRYTAFVGGVLSEGYTHCTWVRPRRSQANRPEWQAFAQLKYPPVDDEQFHPWQFCLNFAEDTGPIKTHEGEVVTSPGIIEEHAGLFIDIPRIPDNPPYGAFGLSGSPVWRFGAAETGWSLKDWSTASARLVGIVTHWNDKLSLLVATRFEEIERRLRAKLKIEA